MQSASLVVVGSGIKFMSHLTTEAKAYILQSDIVLYLVNDPAMKEWIQQNNKQTESLDSIYTQYHLRSHCYRAITAHILETLRRNIHVCVVIYGHPTVYAQPALGAVLQAKNEGYYAKILPGISSIDCLYADLLIDPGSCGCQSFEATDFLLRRRKFDPNSHMILFQVGCVGIISHTKSPKNWIGIHLLLKYLNKFYPLEHEVILYEAAQYPCFEPRIEKLALRELMSARISLITTLYISPAYKAQDDKEMLKLFNINSNDL